MRDFAIFDHLREFDILRYFSWQALSIRTFFRLDKNRLFALPFLWRMRLCIDVDLRIEFRLDVDHVGS